MFPSFIDSRKKRVQRFGFDALTSTKILNRERCFILGMGPSLAKAIPEAFSDEFVIGTNSIMKTQFQPDIICVVDNRRFDYDNWFRSQIRVITVKQIAERRVEEIKNLNAYSDIDYVDYGAGLVRSVLKIDNLDDRLKTVNFAGSVITDLAIPLAAYLGFKECFVLGLDGAEASFPTKHVVGNEKHYQAAHPSHMFHMHEKAAALAEKRGMKVYNSSPGGVVWAFDRIYLGHVKPEAVRTQYEGDLDQKFIVLGGRVARVVASEGGYRLFDEASTKYARHKNNNVAFEKDDGTPVFRDDSTFTVQPSFVNPSWVSFKSVNQKDKFITSAHESAGYRTRRADDMFSPYFSSFRVYSTAERAVQRCENDMLIRGLAEMKLRLGNAMIADDALGEG